MILSSRLTLRHGNIDGLRAGTAPPVFVKVEMNMQKLLALLITVILISAAGGCGSDNGSRDDARTEADKQQALRDSTFGSVTETMDRARSVEQLQQDRKDQLDAAMDHSEGR